MKTNGTPDNVRYTNTFKSQAFINEPDVRESQKFAN